MNVKKFGYHLLAVVLVIPLAPMINRMIPEMMIGSFNADLFAAILLSLVMVRLMLWLCKPLLIPASLLLGILILINTLNQSYTVSSVVKDYKQLVAYNWDNRTRKEKGLYLVKPSLFDTEVERAVKGIKHQIIFNDSAIRSFAVKESTAYFADKYGKYGPTARYLSLFKYINNHFHYVPDPKKSEYYATPLETIENGIAGDCDDHTILMISALGAIGAKTRMVLTENHVYPELYCANKTEFLQLKSAIMELFQKDRPQGLFYREENDSYWINLDYSAPYPGGPYANNKAYAVEEF